MATASISTNKYKTKPQDGTPRRPPTTSQAGGLVRSRPPLDEGLRRAMVRHALRNFLTKLALVGTLLTCSPHFAANLLYPALRVYEVEFFFSIPEGRQKNSQAGGSFDLAPRLHRLRGAMVFHALRTFTKLSALCSIAVTTSLQFVVFRFPC